MVQTAVGAFYQAIGTRSLEAMRRVALPVRTEFRPDGDIATDRVVVVAHSSDGRREFEAADVIVLARRTGEWRVAQAVFGPWKLRTAP